MTPGAAAQMTAAHIAARTIRSETGIRQLLLHGVKIRPAGGGHLRGAVRREVAAYLETRREAELTIAAIATETGLSRYLVRTLLMEQGVILRRKGLDEGTKRWSVR